MSAQLTLSGAKQTAGGQVKSTQMTHLGHRPAFHVAGAKALPGYGFEPYDAAS